MEQPNYYQQNYQPSYPPIPPGQQGPEGQQVNGYSPSPVNGSYGDYGQRNVQQNPPPTSFPGQPLPQGQYNQGYPNESHPKRAAYPPPPSFHQQQPATPVLPGVPSSPTMSGPPTAPPVPSSFAYQNVGPSNGYQQAPSQPPTQGGLGPPLTNRYPPGPMAPSQQNYYPQHQQQQQMHHGPQMGQYQPPQAHPQQQQQRLDPDAMPSVPAVVPPLVTSVKPESIIHDGGCARPQHIRATTYQVPIAEDILKNTSLPFGIVITPFDDSETEGQTVVPITASEIVRCNRCRAYMSPFMKFMDGGRRFMCALCHATTEVPPSYFGHLDHTGQRLDKWERPELHLGSYEFKCTAEFCRNSILNCRRPHIIFAFELTVNSMPTLKKITRELSGVIRECLPLDPLRHGSPPPLVGFMTYNSKIQVYDVKNDSQAHVICDIGQTFPVTTSFLADPSQHMDKIESFLDNLATMYNEDELETESILGPVIEAALLTSQVEESNWFINEVMPGENPAPQPKDPEKSIPAGKVYLFHCTLPTYGQEGVTPGRLKPRWTTSPDEVRRLLGTDKEKLILSPEQSKYYSTLAQKCVADFGSGVELFLFPPINGSYLDIATLGELVRLTGSGGVYKYYAEPGNRFITDLKYSLKSTIAFEAIMKVRTSAGIRPCEYAGNFYSKVSSDIDLGCINTGNSLAVEIKYDDKLPEDELVVIQVAILYTAVSGERRVRCHNIGLSACTQVADVFRNACCDTLMNLLLRQSVSSLRLGEKTPEQVRENLIAQSVKILTAYRKHCAQPGSSLGQLILPEALKLLPVYVCGALKCDAIDGGLEMTPDDKAFAQIRTLGSSLRNTQVILYPKLLRVEYEDDQLQSLKTTQIRCSEMRLNSPNAVCYLLENSFYLFVFIPASQGALGQSQFIKNVFGVDNMQGIVPENGLPELLTSESQFLQHHINSVNSERRRVLRICIIRQGIDRVEAVFRSFLYEDKKVRPSVAGEPGRHDAPSYVDLLCHLHKEIRTQLN